MNTIHHIFHINSSFENIYQTFTTIEGLKKWWVPTIDGDETVGGTITIDFGTYGEARFKVIAKKENTDFAWKYVGDLDDDWYGTIIKVNLSYDHGKVKIDFKHMHFKSDDDFMAQCNFTWGRLLEGFREYCEQGVISGLKVKKKETKQLVA